MSTATRVLETWELTGDDARAVLRQVGFAEAAFERWRASEPKPDRLPRTVASRFEAPRLGDRIDDRQSASTFAGRTLHRDDLRDAVAAVAHFNAHGTIADKGPYFDWHLAMHQRVRHQLTEGQGTRLHERGRKPRRLRDRREEATRPAHAGKLERKLHALHPDLL